MGWRQAATRAHRYVGLALALFLTVAGLSGAVIAFTDEIDGWLNPHLRRAATGVPTADPLDFVDLIEAADPRGMVTFASLAFQPGRSALYFVKPRIDPATGRPYRLGYNQVFADPVTGVILGRRQWGAFAFDRAHLLPAIYEIHYSLFLPEALSGWFLGLLAAAWAIDCFVGASLTLPRARPRLGNWLRAWTLKPRAGPYRRTLDLHRAGGLWLWLVLLLLALTGFYLRVGDDTVRPLLLHFSSLTPSPYEVRGDAEDDVAPALPLRAVLPLATAERDRLGWTDAPTAASYDLHTGIYAVAFQSGRYAERAIGAPTVYVDGGDGRILGHSEPLTGTAADVIVDLPRPLHGGKLGGLPGRILVASAGLGTAMLSITGIALWIRKRRGRTRAGA